MSDSGKAEEAKGTIKEVIGALRGDEDQKDEGRKEQAEGKLRQAGEKVKDAARDVSDAVRK